VGWRDALMAVACVPGACTVMAVVEHWFTVSELTECLVASDQSFG
jgi:hypothetical protein